MAMLFVGLAAAMDRGVCRGYRFSLVCLVTMSFSSDWVILFPASRHERRL